MISENKRSFWRKISLTLILCLVITSIPAMAFAEEEPPADDKDSVQEEETITYLNPEDATEENAVLEESGEDYTTFDLGGTKRHTIFFTENVRFRDENGELTDYDPTLVDLNSQMAAQSETKTKKPEGYAYRNAEGDSYQYIPESLSEETPVLMEKDGYRITLTPTAKTYKDFFGKQVKVKRSKEEIEDAYENVSKKDVKPATKISRRWHILSTCH